jgi:TolB-like protein/Flp pilus assembly protein TadD
VNDEMNTGKPSFLSELKRRNVVRMAGLYLVGAWLLTQVASTVLPMFGTPEWLPRSIVILLAIGFLPALIFSWVFELTPDGLKRDAEVTPEKSIAPQTARRMDRMIIVVLVLALGYFVFDKFALRPRRSGAPNELSSAADSKSIAVLPFVNMSSDKEQEYFSDGLSEELLNQLAQISQLRVIARTSSFSFKGKEVDVSTIAKALNVANVLEGSVRRSANTLRVTAQLIRASDSSHLWSQTYDRGLTDIFKVQDEIATDVVAALKVKLLPAQELPKAPRTNNPEAYQQYLQGRYYLNRFSIPDLEKARAFLERATELDPTFPLAWATLSTVWNLQTGWSDKLTRDQFAAGVGHARDAVDRALKLDPDLPDALTARFAIQFYFDFDWKGGAETIKRAQAVAPSDPVVLISAGQVAAVFGDRNGAVELARRAVALDPVNAQVRVYLATALLQGRKPVEARNEFKRVAELNPSTPWAFAGGGMADLSEGKNAEALAAAEHETTEFARLVVSAAALWNLGRREESDAALATLIKDDADVGAFQIAEVYSGRGDKDNAFLWLDRARRQQDPGIAYYPNDPLLDPLRSDPRWAIFRRSIGLAEDQLK